MINCLVPELNTNCTRDLNGYFGYWLMASYDIWFPRPHALH